MRAIWQIAAAAPAAARMLARALGVHRLTAQCLLNRGLDTPEAAQQFLAPSLHALMDPLALPDMARAVVRLRAALRAREPILIFSDSDVDGLTAAAILEETLRALGGAVRSVHSNRIADGYGLPMARVRQLAHSAVRLVMLVDCGTNQPEAVRTLAAAGIDTIIVDHHVPIAPSAAPHALVNPYAGDGPGRELSSAGLAFKVAQALLEEDGERLAGLLDLAALGVLADCSPLTGDTRILVAEGLPRIGGSRRPGLRALCAAAGLTGPSTEQVVRKVIPPLNAGGRLGDAAAVWHLLRGEDGEDLSPWMRRVTEDHARTRALHRRHVDEAHEQVNRLHFRDEYVLVVSGSDWHQGLMGPLASQLAERYGRPAIALALRDDAGVGSGRSVPMFNLLDALQGCQEHLVQFGGHAQACGLMVRKDHLAGLRAALNARAQAALQQGLAAPRRTADLAVRLRDVEVGWVGEVERFAPFGRGNARPTVLIRDVVLEARSMQTGWVRDGDLTMPARGRLLAEAPAGRCDVVAAPCLARGEVMLTLVDASAPAP